MGPAAKMDSRGWLPTFEGSRMRALVAGDVRFGGLYDLCSISQFDERENVLARFAVVHRERLMVR